MASFTSTIFVPLLSHSPGQCLRCGRLRRRRCPRLRRPRRRRRSHSCGQRRRTRWPGGRLVERASVGPGGSPIGRHPDAAPGHPAGRGLPAVDVVDRTGGAGGGAQGRDSPRCPRCAGVGRGDHRAVLRLFGPDRQARRGGATHRVQRSRAGRHGPEGPGHAVRRRSHDPRTGGVLTDGQALPVAGAGDAEEIRGPANLAGAPSLPVGRPHDDAGGGGRPTRRGARPDRVARAAWAAVDACQAPDAGR